MTADLKQQIINLATRDLEQVELALEAGLNPNLELVRTIAAHLLFSGGKRLRPLLMIHSARMCGYDSGDEIRFSTIFEYLHAATLLHDDVVDGAAMRRGKPAAHTLWSPAKVVLTGDFLLARALDISAQTGSPEIIREIANITQEMSQGEIDQLNRKGDLSLSEADYLETIRRKTAVLIQGACKSGAVLAGGAQEQQDSLDRYGYHLGMAFQMADDLLDYTADAADLGKNPGADIREGKLTLPLIYSLAKAESQDRAWMEKMVTHPEFSPEEFEAFTEKLSTLGGIEYTRKKAWMHVETAMQCLDLFPEGPSKKLLQLIAAYSLKRKV